MIMSSIPMMPVRFSDSRQSSIPATTAPAVPSPDQIAYAIPSGICLRAYASR